MIKYHFRVPSAVVFTLYSSSKALEYTLRVSHCGRSYAHARNTFLLETSFAQTKFKRETCHSTNQTGNAIEY
jgi:hypothetical protein